MMTWGGGEEVSNSGFFQWNSFNAQFAVCLCICEVSFKLFSIVFKRNFDDFSKLIFFWLNFLP